MPRIRCSGSPPTNGDDLPDDQTPDDGYPPQFSSTHEERTINVNSYDTLDREGIDVPLAPIEDVYYWYTRGEARFVDARPEIAWERSRIFGAVWSPAPDGRDADPVVQWPKADRIVCYCGCPHTMASIRAASLISDGYENVYVIDEGFWEWQGLEYPMAGTQVEARPLLRGIQGQTPQQFAGELAWVRHLPTGQVEVAPISNDGTFELDFRFSDINDRSVLVVETPAFRVTDRVSVLTSAVVTGP
ncbi:rhodanese-like domain-containing protein [Haladaptatus sp. GCM10025707]|uniref:rhodanese-like domain-containing protein n=1 Tax=unclassified Haladaptatus TaxID=2622732 RepID=UPI00361789E6